MDINGSKASVGTDDYSLITNEKCNPPRAKLFIVFLVSLVVATLIVLLVVLTRIDTPTDTTPADPDQCADVAIIGGGLAGSYAAWRLRHSNKSVILYEKSDRLGGRFESRTWSNDSSEMYELGASFFVPNLHPLMYKLVKDLELDMTSFANIQASNVGLYHLRGQKVTVADLANGSSPYNLDEVEKHLSPLGLLRHVLGYDELQVKQGTQDNLTKPWKSWLNSESLKDVILHRASYGAYQYLMDTLNWWEHCDAGNALVYLDYVTKIKDVLFPFGEEHRFTVVGGMQKIITELIKQTQHTNPRFRVKTHSELISVVGQPSFNTIQFVSDSLNDGSADKPCAQSVIFAGPPSALVKVSFEPKDVHDIWRAHADKLVKVPMMRVLLRYTTDAPLWPNDTAPFRSVKTDLPLQDVSIVNRTCANRNDTNATDINGYTTTIWVSEELNTTAEQFNISDNGESRETPVECNAYFEVNIYEHHLQYWIYLLNRDNLLSPSSSNADDVITIEDVTSSRFGSQLKRNMDEIFGSALSGSSPSRVIVKLWQDDRSPDAFHVWKPGANWTEITRNLWTPIKDVNLHLVGSDYAPGFLQFWGEGALYAVEELIRTGV